MARSRGGGDGGPALRRRPLPWLIAATVATVAFSVVPDLVAPPAPEESARRAVTVSTVDDAATTPPPAPAPTATHPTEPTDPAEPTAPAEPTGPAKRAERPKRHGGPDCARLRCVALTFDDGPGPYTERLLDVLRAKHTPATFFVLGSRVEVYPGLLRRMATEGHAIGNHTFDHLVLPDQRPAVAARQIDRTSAAIDEAVGSPPRMLRPPEGATSPKVSAMLERRGLSQILWSVDTEDWLDRDRRTVLRRATRSVGAGAIVLMHDLYPSTIDAVPQIIDRLRAQGLTLVTVPQLLGPAALVPGHTYARR